MRSAAGLTFLQIFNSGHLVPKDQPQVALAMVKEFVSPSSEWRRMPVPTLALESLETAPDLYLYLLGLCFLCGLVVLVAVGARTVTRPCGHPEGYTLLA